LADARLFWLRLHRWDLLGQIRYFVLDNGNRWLTDPIIRTSLLVVTTGVHRIVVPVQTVLWPDRRRVMLGPRAARHRVFSARNMCCPGNLRAVGGSACACVVAPRAPPTAR